MIRTGRWWWCWLADYEGPIPVTDVALWHRVQLVPANPTGSRPTHSNPRLSSVHSTSLALPPWLLLPRAPLAHTATLCSDFLSLSLCFSLLRFFSFFFFFFSLAVVDPASRSSVVFSALRYPTFSDSSASPERYAPGPIAVRCPADAAHSIKTKTTRLS